MYKINDLRVELKLNQTPGTKLLETKVCKSKGKDPFNPNPPGVNDI